MPQDTQQRVRIEEQNGMKIYSAGFWPGWPEIVVLSITFIAVTGVFVGSLCLIRMIQGVFEQFSDVSGFPWLSTVFNYLVMGALDLSFIACTGLLVLWLPYFLIYQLSPKQFWIDNDVLYHRVNLLGFIRRQRKIPFERILNVQAEPSNGRHAISVLYEMNLPKLLFVILVYWNERFTLWSLTLINGIPTRQEAKALETALLEPMTASPICRVGDTQEKQE